VLRTLTPVDLVGMAPFTVQEGVVAGRPATIARTGYTGEDGFELVVDGAHAGDVWDAAIAAVRRAGGQPCGLAARDTLRLEAGLPLCGADMDDTTTPLEAGLGWVVKLGKGEFVGRAALQRQHDAGIPRRLVAFVMDEPGIPRHGYAIRVGDDTVGRVTSGTKSPTLGTFIGLGYVGREHAATATSITIDVRGRRLAARVVDRPFYRRARATKET
jgi:aminomethyltransferase